jgi:dipeptidyl aminopeptidase/acylaminoacyl peptidase
MNDVKLVEKYERNGWPSVKRPDMKPPDGWRLSLLTSLDLIHHHSLSPDGAWLAFVWEKALYSNVYVMSVQGGWPFPVTSDRAKTIYWLDSPPRWSPDGRLLAFNMNGHVHVAPADGRGLPQNVSDFTTGAWSPTWLPDSQRLIIAVERNGTDQLLLTDYEGAWPRQLTDGKDGDDFEARVSPDGRSLIYVHYPSHDLNRLELRLLNLESGQMQAITGAPNQKDWSPRWSPDSSQIAFLSQRSGYNEVWRLNPTDGTVHQLTDLRLEVGEIAWMANGRHLAATINHGGAFHIGLIDVQSGQVREIRTGQGVYSSLQPAPDATFLTAEYENSTTAPDIYRINLDDGQATQLTHSMPPALASQALITPEPISYKSFDGLEIPALLFRPHQPNGAAILRPHGGPTAQTLYDWDSLAQYFLAKGYTWIMPNFRGSTGYGVAYEHLNYNDWGVGDTQDCLYGARFLHGLDWINRDRIAIMGSSYGGYMVACCLAQDPDYLFACGVSKYGDAHLYSSWAQCNRSTRLYTEMQIGHPKSNWQVYVQGSPIKDVANIRKPVLLVHGLADDIVPPQASEEWGEALKRHDKVFEYKTYAGEPHGFLKRETERDWIGRMARFLEWYCVA